MNRAFTIVELVIVLFVFGILILSGIEKCRQYKSAPLPPVACVKCADQGVTGVTVAQYWFCDSTACADSKRMPEHMHRVKCYRCGYSPAEPCRDAPKEVERR